MARLGRTQEEIDIARWQCVTEAHAEGRSWAKSYAYTAQQFNHPCYGPLAAGPDMMAHSYKKIQRTGLRLWAAKTELKLGSEKTVVEIRVLSKEKRGSWRLIA